MNEVSGIYKITNRITGDCYIGSSKNIKKWNNIHQDKRSSYHNEWGKRLCLYKGETLTLATLRARFRCQGLTHYTQEARKYLIDKVS